MRDTLEGLYDQFVGRDLFAKIGPGFITLATTAWYVDCELSNLSFGDWAIAIVLAWIAGLGLQSLGELNCCGHQLLRYFPKGTNENEWHDKVGRMQEVDGYVTKYRLGYERLIVIKEACGITCVALLIALGLVVCRYVFDHSTWRFAPVGLLAAAMIYALFRMHRRHVHHQDNYIDRVIDRAAKSTTAHGKSVSDP